jgi:hypothetical protein
MIDIQHERYKIFTIREKPKGRNQYIANENPFKLSYRKAYYLKRATTILVMIMEMI